MTSPGRKIVVVQNPNVSTSVPKKTKSSPVKINAQREISTGVFLDQFEKSPIYESPAPNIELSPVPTPVHHEVNFQMNRKTTQSIRVEFPKDVYLNSGDYTVFLPKLGDMITRLRIVGDFNNTQRESIINKIEFLVNSQVIESLKGDFIRIDNEMKTPLEKVSTSNTLVNGSYSMLDIPFLIIKKGFFMVTEPQIRFSFAGMTQQIVGGYFLVDYTLIEDPPQPTFFQRIRQVQDISVIGTPGCNFIKVDTAFTGPVYQLYFTVQNLNTDSFISTISNVKFYTGGNFERFNLSGSYLRYIEPLKRYGGTPIEPVYLYSFALEPLNISDASGQMNFSRLDSQRFEIDLFPISDPVKVTIWAQSHNFCYFNHSNCSTVFQTFEYTVNSTQNVISIPNLPIKMSQEMINNYAKLNIIYSNNVPLSNTFPLNQVVSTVDNAISGMVLSSPGYSNVIVNTNQSSLNPFFVTFPNATIINLKTDPQNGNVIMLLSNGAIYDQMFGAQIPSWTGTPWDITLDLYANPVVSYSDSGGNGFIQTYQRQTYTPLTNVSLGSSLTHIALYYDGSSVWASYYSNPNCVLLNLTTGNRISKNFGLGTLSAKKFCNSSDYVQYLSSSQTYVLQFSTGQVFTGYFYNDGTKFVKTPDSGTTLVLNNCSATGITFAYNMIYAFDSFQNFYFNVNYSSDIFSINTGSQTLNSYVGGTGLTVTNGVQYDKFTYTQKFQTNDMLLTTLYEDPQTHLMIYVGYNSPSYPYWIYNNSSNFVVNNSYSFLFTLDSTHSVIPAFPNINLSSLNNYVNPTLFYDPSVFYAPNNFIMYPPISMADATGTLTPYSEGDPITPTYTFSAIATSTKHLNGFGTILSSSYVVFEWGGYTGYPSNYSVVISISPLPTITVSSYLQLKTINGLSPATTYSYTAYWIDNFGVEVAGSRTNSSFTTLAPNNSILFTNCSVSTTPTQIIITCPAVNYDTVNSYVVIKYKKSTDSVYTTTGKITFESFKTSPFVITDTVQYDFQLYFTMTYNIYTSFTKNITGTEYGSGVYTISANAKQGLGQPGYQFPPFLGCFGKLNVSYWQSFNDNYDSTGKPLTGKSTYITIQTPSNLEITGIYIRDGNGTYGRYTVDAISDNFVYNILTDARLSSNNILYFPNDEIIINPYTWRITCTHVNPNVFDWFVNQVALFYSDVIRLPGGSATITKLNSSSVSWSYVNFNSIDTLNIYTSLDLVNWTLLTVTTVGVGSYSHLFSSGTYVSLSVVGDTVYQDYNTDHLIYSQYIDSKLPGGSATVTSFTNTLTTFGVNWSFIKFNPSTTVYIYYSFDLIYWSVFASYPLSTGNFTSPGFSHPIIYVALVVIGDPVYQDYNTNYSVYTIIPAI
jgi:hypothetical protein